MSIIWFLFLVSVIELIALGGLFFIIYMGSKK